MGEGAAASVTFTLTLQQRTQREIIEKGIYVEAPLGEDHPKGEKWPWFYFRAKMKQPSAAAVADPKDREPSLPRPLVRSEPTILGEERKEETRKAQSREEDSGGGTKKKSWIQDDANGDGDGSVPAAKKGSCPSLPSLPYAFSGTCTQVIPSLSLTSELNLFLRKVLKSVPPGIFLFPFPLSPVPLSFSSSLGSSLANRQLSRMCSSRGDVGGDEQHRSSG